jgi:hypothetical protein
MSEPPVRPDPADMVPPGERAALADVARDLVVERESLAVTARELVESNLALAETVAGLTHRLSVRTRVLVAVLVVDAFLTLAIAVFGYRYEHFLACQVQQNTEFRNAAAIERAAQRQLLNVILNPNSTAADRYQASQTYYTGLIDADQQRGDAVAGVC